MKSRAAAAKKLKPAAAPKRGSELAAKVERLYELVTERKRMAKEEDELKEWFKAEAGGVDFRFEAGDLWVKTTGKEQRRLDAEKIRTVLGDQEVFDACHKVSPYVEVSVGRDELDDAA